MKKFDIVKNRNIFFGIAAVMIIAAIVSFCTLGFNWDIEFIGGTEISYSLGKTVDKADEAKVEKIVIGVIGQDMFSSIRVVGDNKDTVVLRTKLVSKAEEKVENELPEEETAPEAVVEETEEGINAVRSEITDAILSEFPNAVWQSTDTVGGEVSAGLKRSALVATIAAILLMLVYIAIRFEISSAFSAILCLTHDVVIMLLAYSVLQIPVGSTVIATVLTILGYSINATIIIFDRVRENIKSMPHTDFEGKVNSAIKRTLARSINTTITTLLTIGLIYFMGVTSIKNFALPIIVGILAGAYSSIFLAGNFWCIFRKNSKKKR